MTAGVLGRNLANQAGRPSFSRALEEGLNAPSEGVGLLTRESDAAEMYAVTFAARQDDHVAFAGSMWSRVGRPLTADLVLRGLAGTGPPLSGYFLTPQSTGHVAAIDFDSEDGLALARRCRAALAKRGAPSQVEASRRGAHLWVVCDRVHSGAVLRRFLRAVLRDAEVEETPKVELRPAQDEIKPDGYGSPLRMPTMPNPKTGLRYPMLDEHDRPLPRSLDQMMLEIDWAPAWVVESLAASMRPTPRSVRPGDRLQQRGFSNDDDETASEILRTLWGMPEPKPGHANRCPAHGPDRHPSLSIAVDDKRCWCKTPGCILDNDGRGRGTHELRKLAPGATP